MRSFSLSWHYTVISELKLAVMDLKRAMTSKKYSTDGPTAEEGPAAQTGTLRYVNHSFPKQF
jgi:hypothetical protein